MLKSGVSAVTCLTYCDLSELKTLSFSQAAAHLVALRTLRVSRRTKRDSVSLRTLRATHRHTGGTSLRLPRWVGPYSQPLLAHHGASQRQHMLRPRQSRVISGFCGVERRRGWVLGRCVTDPRCRGDALVDLRLRSRIRCPVSHADCSGTGPAGGSRPRHAKHMVPRV